MSVFLDSGEFQTPYDYASGDDPSLEVLVSCPDLGRKPRLTVKLAFLTTIQAYVLIELVRSVSVVFSGSPTVRRTAVQWRILDVTTYRPFSRASTAIATKRSHLSHRVREQFQSDTADGVTIINFDHS